MPEEVVKITSAKDKLK